jgi:alkanesulfonate monooxygenase SsuD/methylene tetrahydromethanopterin reductase-like flavin-dependent oxidoreductase (luciferase family)
MHVGLGLTLQRLDDNLTDAEVYRRELALGVRAEEAGFDSVWFSEHHFSDYQLTPQTPMVLSWLAGQTTRIKLGQMVSVLPWNDPVRVAESYTVLDHLSGGRAIAGLGRGLGRIEFNNFRLEMGESRQRFTEYSEAILEALETGYIEYDGEVYTQPRAAIRPRPLASFKGRTFAAAVSPASMELMARMAVGILVIAQKPWETAEAELAAYRQRYLEVNGYEAPKPVLVLVVGVSNDRAQVQRMREVYLQRWARSTVDHYEFDNPGSPTSRATSTTAHWPTTSPSTG